jgi:glycosyltransferase involved in cell wall biosynthesis
VGKLNRHLLAHHFDRVVGVSLDIRNHFVDFLEFAPQRVSVIHNGIELPEQPVRGLSHPAVVGSAGRLFPVKDFPLMVEIARIVAEEKGPLRFELAGEGPERNRLEGLIDAWGLRGSFRLHGHLTDVEVFYQGLDIYLNTSLHEGIPMSVLEAMAWGLPVVAPQVGGIGEIIEDGVEGFIVDGRNPKDFAEKCMILKNVDQRKRMGQAARKKVDRLFSAGKMASQYVQLYRELTFDR